MIKRAAHSHALTAVYDDLAEVAAKRGWDWPSYSTVLRRWNALPEIEKLTLRHGGEHAAKTLYQHHRRDVSKLGALDVVEMDGRVLDLWAEFEDGTVARLMMIALVDRASFKALRAAMMMFRGDQGGVLGINPTALIVPPVLEQSALHVVNTEFANGGGSNPWKDTAELIVTPYVAE